MPLSPFGYPLDLTGVAPTNAIVGDVTTFTSPETRSFVPSAGPFYVFNMALRNSVTGELLAPKVDYLVEYLLPDPSMASGKEVAGIVRVINTDVPGVSIDYQVIGGTFGNTVTMLQTYLADNPILPINPIWGEIPDMPVQFPPAAHLTDMATVFGLGPLVNVIEGVRKAILSGDTAAWGAVYSYLNQRLDQEHLAILQDIVMLTRPVPLGPIAGQVLMSGAPTPTTYDWGDYVPTPGASGNVLISTGASRGAWTWGTPGAAALPVPSSAGQVLLSTGAAPGDWGWSEGTAEPRFDVFMYAVDQYYARIVPRKGGYIWIDGVNRKLTAPLTLDASLGAVNTLQSIFLKWNGSSVVIWMTSVLDATATPKMAPNGVVCAYDQNLDHYDYGRIFIGHVHKLPSWVSATYPNMAVLYVRSYYNDAGTTCGGFLFDSGNFHRGPRPFARNGTRVDTAILLGGRYLGGPAGANWGVGWDNNSIPYSGASGLITGEPYADSSNSALVLGTIVWPFEQLRVAGYYNCVGEMDIDAFVGLRTWGFGHEDSGTPLVEHATILEKTAVGNVAYDGNGNRLIAGSLESIFCTDMVYTNPSSTYTALHHLGSFRMFDMIWTQGIYMYGQTGDATYSGGNTRLIVQPVTTNRCLTEAIWPGTTIGTPEKGPAFY